MKKDTIKYVANLARIDIGIEEEELFARQLSDILAYMDKLKILNTDAIEPMSHAVSMGNVLRPDVIKESLPVEKVLENVPSKKGNFIEVPKVIE